ncbi:MAG: hypothetical protein A3F67_07025 [Verrucomicrobia bacterium RIFCSPHIGHO2_12_FULL_41_10]|nr:MAG: hypothetical protein A3F67_07025 [Verrucomicrobia bacterium RIFCSPHIGHO2_12_FULL_41_10]
MNDLINRILNAEKAIRYIAILQGDSLISEQRDNTQNASSSDSDRYEELLVNPTLLKLATQRGDIDCGGLKFLLIRYGNFYQWVSPFHSGHISICIDSNADPISIIQKIQPMLK